MTKASVRLVGARPIWIVWSSRKRRLDALLVVLLLVVACAPRIYGYQLTNRVGEMPPLFGAFDPAKSNPQAQMLERDIEFFKAELEKTNISQDQRQDYSEMLLIDAEQLTKLRVAMLSHTVPPNVATPMPILRRPPPPPKLVLPKHESVEVVTRRAMERVNASMQSNQQLWSDLLSAQVEARKSNDQEAVARAEKRLADFLAEQYGKARGKSYPSNATLAEVITGSNVDQGHSGNYRRRVVWEVLAGIVLAPAVALMFYKLRHKR